MSRFNVGDTVRVKPDSPLVELRGEYEGMLGKITYVTTHYYDGTPVYTLDSTRRAFWGEGDLELVVNVDSNGFENVDELIT